LTVTKRESIVRPLEKDLYGDIIYETLRNDIVRGEYGFGEKLELQKLTTLFGVSRSPVVQAIAKLQHEGLVFIKPNVGSFIFEPTHQDINEIIQLRCALELCALELAFEHLDDALLETMQTILDSVNADALDKDPELFLNSDRHFHDTFFIAAGNSRLRNTMTALRSQIEIFRIGTFSRTAAMESMHFHQRIVDALRARDISKAKGTLKEHLAVTCKFAHEILKASKS
jgi:DNA-binding GntR family transcriptional regulator